MTRARSGLPLRPTLVTVVVALIMGGSAAVGALAYATSNRAVGSLWHELADQVAGFTAQRTLRYFESARPYVAMTRKQAELGRLDVGDPMAMLDHFRAAVEANPEFTWASYGAADGTYIAAYRDPSGKILGTWRQVIGDGETRLRTFEPRAAGWQQIDETTGDYDPRKRGWYEQAAASRGGVWTEPFVFATVKKPGFMYAAADRRGGELHGVWAVEYEVSYLSEFLSSIHVGAHGRVYVVTGSGLVVGHPEGQVTTSGAGDLAIVKAADHRDPVLAGAWRQLERRGGGSQRFEFGDYLAMAEPFPARSGIDWSVLVVVPAHDFFGSIRSQAWTTLAIALGAAFIAVLAGAFFSNRVSGSLRVIADEMDRVGSFELDGAIPDEGRSFVREVNAMGDAVARMKRGLRSFAKYVPRDLVRGLIRSGEEAELGARKCQLTVLFSDIAGFTSIAEKMDPDELAEVLGECLQGMSEAIRAEGGTLDKYIGDGIMAFWGAPTELPEHAVAACRAALAMSRCLAGLQEHWVARGQPRLDLRIGINTGEVLVGNFGSAERLNYTALGDDVNVASRLEGLNKFYGTGIVMGEHTAERVAGAMVTRPLDWVAVKGKTRPILIHELVGAAGEVHPDRLAEIEVYREALELYRARDFAAAAERFAASGGGDGGPAAIMARRCRDFVADPPPEDWDGTHVLTQK